MGEFFRRLHYLLNRRKLDSELANEMEFHREMTTPENGAAFGNALRLREESRDAWGWTWLDALGQDLRYALRQSRKSPGFTLAATFMLAIGIGTNVAAFGFFNLLLLKPLAVREPQSLLRFQRLSPDHFAHSMPYPEMDFFRAHAQTLNSFLALSPGSLSMEGEDKPITAHCVTANFFTDLGAIPAVGGLLDNSRDGNAAAVPVVVLSFGFWQRHFAGDPNVTGRIVHLNGKPATVVGVVTNDFTGLSMQQPDIYLPIGQVPCFIAGSKLLTDVSEDGTGVQFWGRLKPGVSAKVAEQELASLAGQLRKRYPNDIWEHESIPSRPGGVASGLMEAGRHGTGKEGGSELLPIFALITALALLILAAACTNLGSLLLARSVAREREIGVRTAVGAGRGRLVRQLFTESCVLAMLGSTAGLGFGYAILRCVLNLTEAVAWLDPTPDWSMALWSIFIGFFAAVLFGLTPALQIARQRHKATFVRQILICAQVTASCVLLIVAGLLVRALNRAVSEDPGFKYQQVIAINPSLQTYGYSGARARVYIESFVARLRSQNGVQSVSLAISAPLGRRTSTLGTNIGGRPFEVVINSVDPEFFQTMDIPLLRGRNLRLGEKKTVVISQSLASRWPTGDPLGRQFAENTVVGIAGNAHTTAMQDPDAMEAYFPPSETDYPWMVVLVKTTQPVEQLAKLAVQIAQSIDPKVFPSVEPLKNSFMTKLHAPQRTALVMSVLGGVALLLACLGIVGLVSYAVSQRTKEIGLRMALGAKPGHVLAVVLRQFAAPVGIGLLFGVGAAAGLAQLLRHQLYGVSGLDPITYLGASGLFVFTVTLAALWPARRALTVDPMLALRHD